MRSTSVVRALIAVCVLAALWGKPVWASGYELFEAVPARARVVTVIDEEPEEGPWGFAMRRQTVTLRILGGPHRGQTFTVENYISGQPAYDIVLRQGDVVMVNLELVDGQAAGVFIEDFARDRHLYGLAALFAVALVLMGGRRGLRALLVLLLTLLGVFYVLLPRLLAGYPPLPTTVGICALVTVLTMLLVGGLTRKALAAAVGTSCGVVIAGLLAHHAGGLARLMGVGAQEAQLLYLVEGLDLDFRGLLFSGMVLGALGAIMDVAMAIASATEEVRRASPRSGPAALFRAGMNVGRDIMGTMVNTLVLAYAGGALPLLLLLMAYEAPLAKVLNLDLVATEVVRALAGSIGIVGCVPFTAGVSMALFLGPAGRRTALRFRGISRRL